MKFLVFSIFILFSCAKNKNDNMVNIEYGIKEKIETYQWNLPVEESVIRFSENTYLLGHSMWDGAFCKGEYKIKDNAVEILYPNNYFNNNNLAEYQKNVLSWVFSEKDSVIFYFDADYKDFYTKTCLRSEEKILINYKFVSPYDCEYTLGNVNVLKKDSSKNAVVVIDNLRIRELPSREANTKEVPLYFVFDSKEIKTDIVYKNSVNYYDAKTIYTDNIDGVIAPWYHICFDGFEDGLSVYAWVFGAYVQELNEQALLDTDLLDSYKKKYFEVLYKNNLISHNPMQE
ncbi:MAG: hypothetical protein Ta2B_07350 [Termitinemataceae bacterium]|nr:MAG: hypothetical protein Ta2B_07350 [Termitinemataceae bacterium]